MRADLHLHSSFSEDSDTPMEEMILAGIQHGFHTLCFTEHMDFDFPPGEFTFMVDTKAYSDHFFCLKEQYRNQIELLFGIELGLQPHLNDRLSDYLKDWPFDFVIGSSHVVNRKDPYYPSFYEGRTEYSAYLEYFESILSNIYAFDQVDSYGHLDYIVRYGPDKNRNYSYKIYREILDEILKALIDRNIALEVNSSGFKYGLGHPHPTEEILCRYRELGGELLTLGSDGHKPEHLGYDFSRLPALLKSCGFQYYTIFRERNPFFYPL